MNVYVLSRQEIEHIITSHYKKFNKWALISIYNMSGPLLNECTKEILRLIGCHKTLSLKFSDISNTEYYRLINQFKTRAVNRLFLFSTVQAKKIISFVDRINTNTTDLVVHCEAGISRSGAVALFACRYLNLDEQQFWQLNKRKGKHKQIQPNRYVYDTLYHVSGMKKLYQSFWQGAISDKLTTKT